MVKIIAVVAFSFFIRYATFYHKFVCKFTCSLRAVIFIRFNETAPERKEKMPISLAWPIQIWDLSQIITFLQSCIFHDFFPLTLYKLVFPCLVVSFVCFFFLSFNVSVVNPFTFSVSHIVTLVSVYFRFCLFFNDFTPTKVGMLLVRSGLGRMKEREEIEYREDQRMEKR